MRSLLLTQCRRLELVETPSPEPGPLDVRVRVRCCGICGSDVHGFDGSTGRQVPPLITGHEAAGVVESVGEGVEDLVPGEAVHAVGPRRSARETGRWWWGAASSAC